MDPTTAIPLHFTLQALALSAAGFLLAWTLVRRRWVGAVGAGLFAAAEGLHAGRFFAADDEPALVVLRLVGLAALYSAAISDGARRTLYSVGAAAIAGGTAWGAITGGGIADFEVGPHVLTALGSILLGGWALLASRDSIRLRVLTALVGMLAVVVVAGGGAVSRVAAIDKRNEELRQLGEAAGAIRAEILGRGERLASRAVNLSFGFADNLSSSRRVIGLDPNESLLVVDRDARVRFTTFHDLVFNEEAIRLSGAVRSALAGATQPASFDVVPEGLVVVGAAAIYRSGAVQPTPDDVVGAIALIDFLNANDLRRAGARVALIGRDGTHASDPSLEGVVPLPPGAGIVTGRAETSTGPAPAAAAVIDGVRMLVVGSDAGVANAATDLLRALLVAILAAAVLAAVSALWLSARVTRPIVDLAEEAERAKTDFLSSLSHELRTPLTPIRGYTELLRKGRVPPRRAADYLDEIGDAAGRLERIVTLLLDVAAQEAGRFRVNAAETRPTDLLDEAAGRWRPRGRRHPVRVEATRSLPRVHADPNALSRVLDELIDNAIKFSPDGGPIELRARRGKDGVEISVADSGIGISPEQSKELIRAFAQVESGDRRRYGGLGLGLAYVSGVLAAHNAALTLRSEPGGGTTFSFTLPTASMVSRMPARTSQRGSARPGAGS